MKNEGCQAGIHAASPRSDGADPWSCDGSGADVFARRIVDCYGAVLAFARRQVSNEDAEDVAQETFLRALTRRERQAHAHRLRAWLLGIASRVVREHHRKQASRRTVSTEALAESGVEMPQEMAALPSVDLRDDYAVALESMSRLLPGKAALIVLHHMEGIPIRALATQAGKSESSVKSALMRARRELLRRLLRADPSHRLDGGRCLLRAPVAHARPRLPPRP